MNSAIRTFLTLAVLMALGWYSYSRLRGPQGLSALFAKQAQIRELEEKNAALQREIQMERERLRKFNENQAARDLEVRKRLKMLQPGEMEFILPKTEAAVSAPAESGPPNPASKSPFKR